MSVTQIQNWKDDVFSEKTLIDVFKASLGVVGNSYDTSLFFVVSGAGIILSIFSALVWDNAGHPASVARILQDWSIISAGFASAILGFLIAGFSIFAAMTERKLFHEMAQIKTNGRSISDFKFIFYNFLFVFIHYLIFLGVSLVFCFLLVPQSPVWFVGKFFYEKDPYFVRTLALIVAVIFGSYCLYMLMLLRSFIWSMYQSLLIAIFADA